VSGLAVDLSAVTALPGFLALLLLLIVAFGTRIIGICMNARGAVDHPTHIFSSLVRVVVATTLATPLLLRALSPRLRRRGGLA
jgi:hypothetical protein